MGMDSVATFPKWRKSRMIRNACCTKRNRRRNCRNLRHVPPFKQLDYQHARRTLHKDYAAGALSPLFQERSRHAPRQTSHAGDICMQGMCM